MGRIREIDFEELTPEQKRVYKEIAKSRQGTVRGPFAIWIRNPKLAERASGLGDSLRIEGKLDKRLFELMVLVIARQWTAQYEWYAHENTALENGLSLKVVNALREGLVPEFERDDERLIYEIVTELGESKTIGPKTYDRAVAELGEDLLIELITAAGYYTMVAMVLNAFEAAVPGGSQPLSKATKT